MGGGSLLLLYMTQLAHISQVQAQGINLLYFLPTAAAALPAHYKNGFLEKSAILPAVAAGLVGTALAAWVATSIDVALLRKLFGLFLIFVGIREWFRA